MKTLVTYGGRLTACAVIILLSFLLMPKTSESDVYLRSLENRVADLDAFPYQILGGGPMDVSINGQRADSLLIRTPLSPLEAVQKLYDAHYDPNNTSSKHLMGVLGEEDWATYIDVFPGQLEEMKSENYVASLMSNPENPALVVAAHRDKGTETTIVNFLVFTEVADLHQAFMNDKEFALDFHVGDKTLGQMSFEEEYFRSADNVTQDYIAEAMEDGLALQLKTSSDGITALHFTGHQKSRDIFIEDSGENSLGIIKQNRNSKGIEIQ